MDLAQGEYKGHFRCVFVIVSADEGLCCQNVLLFDSMLCPLLEKSLSLLQYVQDVLKVMGRHNSLLCCTCTMLTCIDNRLIVSIMSIASGIVRSQ